MKRIKSCFVSVTALLLAMLLCSCGNVKTAWIAGRLGAAIRRSPVTSISGNLTAEVQGKALGIPNSSGLTVDFKTGSQGEGMRGYTEADSVITMLGVKIPQHYEIFSDPQADQTTYYIHLAKPSLWARASADMGAMSIMDLDPSLLLILLENTADTAQVQTVEEHGLKNLQISMHFSMNHFREIMSAAGKKMPPEVERLNLEDLTVPVVLELNSQTYLPQSLSLRVDGLSGELLTELARAAGRDLKGVELESGSLALTISEFGYGTQSVPELPPEAADGADQMEELRSFMEKLFS